MNDKGQCCGKKRIIYKRPLRMFCPRCDRAYDVNTGKQIENWAWKNIDGKFQKAALMCRLDRQPQITFMNRLHQAKLPEVNTATPLPPVKPPKASSDKIKILESKEEVKGYLLDVLRYCPKIISFDYKTNMADPRHFGARILCASICWQNTVSTAWPWAFTDIGLYRKIMQHPDIGKVGFSKLLKHSWTQFRVPRTRIQGWRFELKIHYDSRYEKAVSEKILLQCGMDSLTEYQVITAKMIETGVIS